VLLRAVFAEDMQQLERLALERGVSKIEWEQLLAYAAAVLQNCGNYRSFGDKKFIPQLAPDKFWTVVECSRAFMTHREPLLDMYAE
jgi:dipeptidyl-peptidase-3